MKSDQIRKATVELDQFMEREYAEERAHVTELCELEEENRKLREELDLLQELAVKVTVEREKERKSAQQEIERLREENRKMIEGLRKLAKTNAENISEIREWKAKQNDPEVTDLDWYNYVARDILKEIVVMMSE